MKRFLYAVIIVAVILVFFSFTLYSSKTENKTGKTTGKITRGMTLGSYHQIETEEGRVTIGDPILSGPITPQVTLSKWDAEASMNISYPMVQDSTIQTQDNTITWRQKDKDVYFKQITKEQQNLENPAPSTNSSSFSNKFEFDILLKVKPASNVFTYNIGTKNLDFFYQPPLNEENTDKELNCSQTECKDKNGNIVNSRPENVVGSYAVYYKDGKSGDFSKAGGKNYQTGKAFHIFRPKITDAKGQEIWGTLNVILGSETTPESDPGQARMTTGQSTLTVTVDPSWLASAVYPVTVDPNFGYESIGASSAAMNNTIRGSYFAIPDNGTPTSISAYIQTSQTCFTGDTLITMADGSYKKIKDIRLGEKVQSYNEKTKEAVTDTIVKLFHHPKEEMGEYYLTIETDDGKKVEVTPNHRVYLEGKWVPAGYLKEGDRLLSDKNKKITIVKMEKVYRQVSTYNLEIEKNHVYFADFLVHNAKPSFLAGTQITMADSSLKDIEKIKAGEKIKSYNLKTKRIETSDVKEVALREHDDYLIITDIYDDTLKVTSGHPIFVNDRWRLARQVKAGDSLLSEFGNVKVKSVQEVNGKTTAYNLIVPVNHNYYANGKLVNDESMVSESGDIAAGSNVLTDQGYKKIEDLVVGEKLPTYNPQTYEIETGYVTEFMIGQKPQSVFVINNSLLLTGQTQIYTRMGEKKVEELEIGDGLIHANGKHVSIFSITQGLPRDVYSLGVSGNHNLFVDGYLIHNATGNAKTAIYQQSDNTQVITSAENTFTETDSQTTAWRTFTITGSPNLVASTNYWLYAWGSLGLLSSITLYYDSSGNGVNKAVTYGAWPDPLTGQTTDSRKYSIYATYTIVPTLQIKPGVKINPGVKFQP